MKRTGNGEGSGYRKCEGPEIGEYKGHPTLTIPYAGDRAFTFGVAKAAAIIRHLDALEAFVKQYGNGD